MANLLVRNLDKTIIARLKDRAARHGRSLQGEVKALLEQTTGSLEEALKIAAKCRQRFKGRKFDDSVNMIREDRQR